MMKDAVSADSQDSSQMEPTPQNMQQYVVLENLKRCPLCGAVNAMENHECFACSWHGEFDHDSLAVEDGLIEMLGQCPELFSTFEPIHSDSVLIRAERLVRRIFRRRFDIRI